MFKLIFIFSFLTLAVCENSFAAVKFYVAAKTVGQPASQNTLVQGAVWQCDLESLNFCNSICNNSDCFLKNVDMKNTYSTNSQQLRVIFSRASLYINAQEESNIEDVNQLILSKSLVYLNTQSFLNFYTNKNDLQSNKNFDQFCPQGDKGTFIVSVNKQNDLGAVKFKPEFLICSNQELKVTKINKLKFLLN